MLKPIVALAWNTMAIRSDRFVDDFSGHLDDPKDHPGGAEGSVAIFCVDCEASATERLRTRQAATSNSEAMNRAWALMSRPPMFRTCPFLIIAIAS